MCLVLVVRRLCRRRGGAHHHHSRRGGKHDFNEGERVLSFSREEYAFQAGVLSSVSGLARDEKAIKMRKGGAKFFVFWLPRFNTKFSPKFLDKKKRDTEREKEMEREREREILLILCWCFLFREREECFSLFFFVKVVCFLMSCVLERLCAFKRE